MNVSLASSHLSAHARLNKAAIALMIAMPFVMVIAHRSSQLVMTLVALCCVGALFVHPYARLYSRLHVLKFFERMRYAFEAQPWRFGCASVGLIALLAFTVWRAYFHALGEAISAVLASAIVIVLFRPRITSHIMTALWASMMVACLVIMLELYTGLGVRQTLGVRWNSYIFNRPLLVLVLLYWPLMYGLSRYIPPTQRIIMMLAITFVLVCALFKAESSTAVLTFYGSLVAWGLARLSPRMALTIFLWGMLSAFALAPVVGDMALRLLPDKVHTVLEQGHSRDRVEIWVSFGALTRINPIFGQGFATSAIMAQQPDAQKVDASNRLMLGVGHPHQMILQIWVELGIMGVIALLVAIMTGVVRPLAKSVNNPSDFASVYALTISIFLIAHVGHGLWQGWWLAAIGASIAWFKAMPQTVALR